jgi:hypothetical protein
VATKAAMISKATSLRGLATVVIFVCLFCFVLFSVCFLREARFMGEIILSTSGRDLDLYE